MSMGADMETEDARQGTYDEASIVTYLLLVAARDVELTHKLDIRQTTRTHMPRNNQLQTWLIKG